MDWADGSCSSGGHTFQILRISVFKEVLKKPVCRLLDIVASNKILSVVLVQGGFIAVLSIYSKYMFAYVCFLIHT